MRGPACCELFFLSSSPAALVRVLIEVAGAEEDCDAVLCSSPAGPTTPAPLARLGPSAPGVGGSKCDLDVLFRLLKGRGVDRDVLWTRIEAVILRSLFAVAETVAFQVSKRLRLRGLSFASQRPGVRLCSVDIASLCSI